MQAYSERFSAKSCTAHLKSLLQNMITKEEMHPGKVGCLVKSLGGERGDFCAYCYSVMKVVIFLQYCSNRNLTRPFSQLAV